MDAFVFVRARPGKVEDVVAQIQAVRGIRRAVAVVGDWDVLAAVHGSNLTAIAADVMRLVHGIDGVERTLTAPVAPAHVSGVAGGGIGLAVPMHRSGEACFVRVRTEAGSTTHVFEVLSELDDIAGVAMLGGEDDLLAEIPLGWEEASRVILGRIHDIEGVRSTNTLVAIPSLPAEDEDRDQFSAWS